MRTLPIFVYGTLQRGEQRESVWPCAPQRVERATVSGQLFDLGPYPALVPGIDVVAGELWWIPATRLAETLEVLDRVEGFNQPGEADWYRRDIVACRLEEARVQDAWTYRFATATFLQDRLPLRPGATGCVAWHRYRDTTHPQSS